MKPAALASTSKLNLFLEVLGRRGDGYHELSTIFQEIDLGDRLAARPAPGLSLRGTGLPPGNPDDNLVLRAARVFEARLGRPLNLRLHLEKRVPMGAGLGGGSGDAAAALALCAKASGKPFLPGRWAKAARSLGADVPFFLQGGLAEGKGLGEKLTPLPDKTPRHFVLLFPRLFTSTPEVFKGLHFPLTKRRSGLTLKRALSDGAPPRVWAPLLFNRLEEVAFRRWPRIARSRKALEAAGCLAARMTGSGSAVYGVVESQRQGRAVMERLGRGNWDLWLVQSVKRL